ncbi:SDR family NAD(P)-dependent oxidoreductase [Chromobacterium subtsugae]|uniref:SDR family NAD(P)-dependent oxidoreductase n=1 Tax=Chromobacterium subtsugae TaxID=251747 RepID=UPI0007F93318|nr:SDR family oxidoreductase [Chromobacterium subtsugae]OBU87846.1 hypothetical protein MY55_03355 [Chromobacterium subtsugae]
MDTKFAGKVALVTGAGSGLGRELALELARQGAAVVLAGRNEDKLKAVQNEIEAAGAQALSHSTDISLPHEVDGLFEAIRRRYGRLDIAVNNAAIWETGLVAEQDEAAWRRIIDTNLNGTWRCMRAEIGLMQERGEGVIVNLSSIVGGHFAMPGTAAYGASKAGIEALTRTAAKECIQQGIRINTVSPAALDTPMSLLEGETEEERGKRLGGIIPIGRVGRLSEVVQTILWICSGDASFFVGHDFVVDGGVTA